MKKLGFGLMGLPQTEPSDASKVDIEQVKQMVDLFMAKGFTYDDNRKPTGTSIRPVLFMPPCRRRPPAYAS